MEKREFNYKSDFDIILHIQSEDGEELGFPDYDFTAKFYTSLKCNAYEASCHGGKCVNCFNDDGRIHVVFNDHHLSPGELQVEFRAEFPDGLYPDGLRRTVIPHSLCVRLVNTQKEPCSLSVTLPDAKRAAAPFALSSFIHKGVIKHNSPKGWVFKNFGVINLSSTSTSSKLNHAPRTIDVGKLFGNEHDYKMYFGGFGLFYGNITEYKEGLSRYVTYDEETRIAIINMDALYKEKLFFVAIKLKNASKVESHIFLNADGVIRFMEDVNLGYKMVSAPDIHDARLFDEVIKTGKMPNRRSVQIQRWTNRCANSFDKDTGVHTKIEGKRVKKWTNFSPKSSGNDSGNLYRIRYAQRKKAETQWAYYLYHGWGEMFKKL